MPRIDTVYGNDPKRLPFDFTDVLAIIAPRAVYIHAALDDSNFFVSSVQSAGRSPQPGTIRTRPSWRRTRREGTASHRQREWLPTISSRSGSAGSARRRCDMSAVQRKVACLISGTGAVRLLVGETSCIDRCPQSCASALPLLFRPVERLQHAVAVEEVDG